MTAGSHGVELVLELIRSAARGYRCGSCDRPLETASVEARTVDPGRIVARLRCPCGAAGTVEVRPASDGHATLR